MSSWKWLYEKGYRYRIHITDGVTVLSHFVQTLGAIGPLMRTHHPNGTITKVENLDGGHRK